MVIFHNPLSKNDRVVGTTSIYLLASYGKAIIISSTFIKALNIYTSVNLNIYNKMIYCIFSYKFSSDFTLYIGFCLSIEGILTTPSFCQRDYDHIVISVEGILITMSFQAKGDLIEILIYMYTPKIKLVDIRYMKINCSFKIHLQALNFIPHVMISYQQHCVTKSFFYFFAVVWILTKCWYL